MFDSHDLLAWLTIAATVAIWAGCISAIWIAVGLVAHPPQKMFFMNIVWLLRKGWKEAM